MWGSACFLWIAGSLFLFWRGYSEDACSEREQTAMSFVRPVLTGLTKLALSSSPWRQMPLRCRVSKDCDVTHSWRDVTPADAVRNGRCYVTARRSLIDLGKVDRHLFFASTSWEIHSIWLNTSISRGFPGKDVSSGRPRYSPSDVVGVTTQMSRVCGSQSRVSWTWNVCMRASWRPGGGAPMQKVDVSWLIDTLALVEGFWLLVWPKDDPQQTSGYVDARVCQCTSLLIVL